MGQGPQPCPCGDAHADKPTLRAVVEADIARSGVTIRVRAPAGAWLVPRTWFAFHGLEADELAGLAGRYGWRKVGAS